MAFKDLQGDLALALPYAGRTYLVEPIDAELGPQVQALVDVMIKAQMGSADAISEEDQELLSDLGEQELYPRLLGKAYDQMVDDNVPWAVIKRAAATAMFDACLSREAAEAVWNGVGKAPNRATRRATTKASSASASRTRSQASTAGTTTRAPAKKAASRGRKSSRAGIS